MTRLAEVKAERDAARAKAGFYAEALHLVVATNPDHTERFRDDGAGGYEIRGYGLTRANGGTVIIIYRHDGQADSISAELLDDFQRTYRANRSSRYLPFAIAADRIAVARQKLLDTSY